MKFMLRLHLTNPTQKFQALAIVAMMLSIGPTAQAATGSIQHLAMRDQLSGKATDLSKLCDKGKADNQNSVINLDIDVNRDGISDQLLAATQQKLDIQEVAQKQFQAKVERTSSEAAMNALIEELNTINVRIGSQFNARMPYSGQVKRLFAAENRIIEQMSRLQPSQKDRYKALEAKKAQIYQKYSQDPSYIKVEEAQRRTYNEIERRGSAKWLYSPPQSE
jgi:hypothetical protein